MAPIAVAAGVMPGVNPSLSSARAIAPEGTNTCTGTSQLARGPLTLAAAWWSPSTIRTGARLPRKRTKPASELKV